MNKSVWKYELSPDTRVAMPKGANIIAAQVRRGVICIWALVNTKAASEERRFLVFDTGHEIDADLKLRFIDTVQIAGGSHVFHVFEVLL